MIPYRHISDRMPTIKVIAQFQVSAADPEASSVHLLKSFPKMVRPDF